MTKSFEKNLSKIQLNTASTTAAAATTTATAATAAATLRGQRRRHPTAATANFSGAQLNISFDADFQKL